MGTCARVRGVRCGWSECWVGQAVLREQVFADEVAQLTFAGLGIGVVAALMGVAGGEMLIPTIVLLYAIDIKIAGSLSLAVSLPTMLVAFARYSRDRGFAVLRDNTRFLLVMSLGSVIGTVVGGMLLGVVPSRALIPALVLLLVSAVRVWRHDEPSKRPTTVNDSRQRSRAHPGERPPHTGELARRIRKGRLERIDTSDSRPGTRG